jgi:hypothetical protein
MSAQPPSVEAFQAEVERLERDVGDEDPETLGAWTNLARALMADGQGDAACGAAQRVFLTWERLSGPDSYDTLRAAHLLGMLRHQAGDLEGAKQIQIDTLERMRLLYGLDDKTTLAAMVNLANTLGDLRQYDELVLLDKEIVSAREEFYGPYDKRARQSMAALAQTLRQVGKPADAKRVEREMLNRGLRARLPWMRR